MSAYHLPNRGLPQELLDVIFSFALYCPRSVRIIQRKSVEPAWYCCTAITRLLGHPDFSVVRLDTGGNLATGLFFVSRKYRRAAVDNFFRNNVFVFDVAPGEALEFLCSLGPRSQQQIRHVHIGYKCMAVPKPYHGDRSRFRMENAKFLADNKTFVKALLGWRTLDTLTLTVADDDIFSSAERTSQRDLRLLDSPTVNYALTALLSGGGRVQKVRFAYPRWYRLSWHSALFVTTAYYLRNAFIDNKKLLQRLAVRKAQLVQELLSAEHVAGGNAYGDRVEEICARDLHKIYRQAGFHLYRDRRRLGEMGTVVAIVRAEEAERPLELYRRGNEIGGELAYSGIRVRKAEDVVETAETAGRNDRFRNSFHGLARFGARLVVPFGNAVMVAFLAVATSATLRDLHAFCTA